MSSLGFFSLTSLSTFVLKAKDTLQDEFIVVVHYGALKIFLEFLVSVQMNRMQTFHLAKHIVCFATQKKGKSPFTEGASVKKQLPSNFRRQRIVVVPPFEQLPCNGKRVHCIAGPNIQGRSDPHIIGHLVPPRRH